MRTVNYLLFALLTTASLNINAHTMSGYLDLSKLYAATNAKRGNKEALSFYTTAQSETVSLSLGQGFIELK